MKNRYDIDGDVTKIYMLQAISNGDNVRKQKRFQKNKAV